MPSDTTTFFLSFTAIFGGLAYGLWLLQRRTRDLEARLAALEADAPATTPKNAGDDGPDQA